MIERVTLAPCGHLPVHLKYEKGTKTIICELCAEHDKRVRAEVLAACINALCLYCAAGDNPGQVGTHAMFKDGFLIGQFHCVATPLRELQPAAKDLEGLLREAEVKGLQFALCAAHDEYVDEIIEEVINRRIAELEKARAIKGKG